jgi:hypothetical protein
MYALGVFQESTGRIENGLDGKDSLHGSSLTPHLYRLLEGARTGNRSISFQGQRP